jgi:succinate dehydrogenase hydrophobic anchor subunit
MRVTAVIIALLAVFAVAACGSGKPAFATSVKSFVDATGSKCS